MRWYAQLKEFEKAVGALQAAGQNADLAGMTAACQQFHDNISIGWQSLLPTPDPALSAALQSAIDDLHDAMHKCLSGVATMNQKDFEEMQSFADQAQVHIQTISNILTADLAGN